MSYNITRIVPITNDGFAISVAAARAFILSADRDRAPEDNFIEKNMTALLSSVADYEPVKALRWEGEGSGYSWSSVCLPLLKSTRGTFECAVVWEGGDDITGLRVVDGVVTTPAVKFGLDG